MKFDSKLLLEQLIRTHILEQSIVTDTNVKRGKVGSATSYGSIDSPSNVSSADRSFFDKVNSIKRTNPKSKRPYIKLYSNVTKGGTASENDRLQSVAGVARREASALIDRFGGPGALSEYSAIISEPQDAKKQADASSTVSYDPSAKLYYTVVFIMTSDINTTISPKWGVTGTMKFFGEDQISSLKPVVTPKDDEVIDDTNKNKQDIDTKDDSELTPEQLSNQFITKKPQLNNLGNSGESAKNLQRAMYTFGMKETSGNLKNFPEFKSFINASWNTSRVPGDWDGEIGTRSKALIDILKAGFKVTSDSDLYTKLQEAINEIQPNLSESKLYKLTEQAGFDIDKAKKASSNKQSVVKNDDSSSSTKTTTTKSSNAWKCVLTAAYAADEISIDGKMSPLPTVPPADSKKHMNRLETIKNIDYIVFNQKKGEATITHKYYPDGTKFVSDIKSRYDCTDPILQRLNVVTKKNNLEYRQQVIEASREAGDPFDGKSISQLIYEAALFLKAFWAGKDLTGYTYSWYQPFTGSAGFKLSDWRDSYSAAVGFDTPDPAVVTNYDSAGAEMIKKLINQANKMRNTEFYSLMDALYKISASEIEQFNNLVQFQRDLTIQAREAIFNQVTSKPFTIYTFETESDSPLISDDVFQAKPGSTTKIVTADYE